MLKQQVKIWVAIVFLIGLFLGNIQLHTLAAEQTNQASVTVIGSDPAAPPSVPEKTVGLAQNDTAFNALVNAVGANNVAFHDDPTYGKYLTGINGVSSVDGSYWAFYINGVSSPVGVDSYPVQNNDKLAFKYTDYPSTQKSAAALKVIGKDQQVLYSSQNNISFLNSATAFRLLQSTLGNDKVGYSDSSYGKYITSIDGITAKSNDYWAFYVNGKKASVGADSYQLQPGDQVLFKYETWQPASNVSGGSNSTSDPAVKTTIPVIAAADLQKAIDAASHYVLSNQVGEWDAVALRQAGKSIPAGYLQNTLKTISEKKGHFVKITDPERYILGILAAGGNPLNANSYNLVETIYNGNVTKQGLNGAAYALIALDSAQFNIPETAKWTKDKLVALLGSKQNPDGGWALDGSTQASDIDLTAMVLTALAPYKDQSGIKEKIDKAVSYLSSQYTLSKFNNSSTTAQAVIALSALGIDANGSLFEKNNSSLLKYLLSFQNTDGGFDWQGGDKSDSFSTSQPFEALVAYQLRLNGKGFLYHLPFSAKTATTAVPVPASNNNLEQKQQGGHALPDTATNSVNLILFGAGIMMIGGVLYFVRLRKKW